MRRIIVAMVCALLATLAQAQAITALSTIINAGHWLLLGQKRVYYIEVESRGETFDAARNEAFKLAVEQAVGTLILSETESQNYRLRKNDITTYASGYVDRFEIIDRTQIAGQTRLKLRVWVAHSAIAGRLLHQQTEPKQVSGSDIAAQIQTFRQQQESADRLINSVLHDYPGRAFDLSMEPARVVVDSQRQAHLQVPFVVAWSKTYLDALEEVMRRINQYPQCTSVLADCRGARNRVEIAVNVISKDPGAWFNDDSVWDIMYKNMVTVRPTYKLVVHSQTGRRFEYCYFARELDNLEYRPRYFVTFNPGVVKIHGHHRDRMVLSLPLSQLPVEDITQVNVEIVKNNQCRQH